MSVGLFVGKKLEKEGKGKFLSCRKGVSSFANFGLRVGFVRFANVLVPVFRHFYFRPVTCK